MERNRNNRVRYQVFVSSTYEDLIEERKQVTQAILECNCFPAGMELFPASDKSQWDFIKQVIDESDIYLVIIAGRYGTTKKGKKPISYTEMEFNYAKKIKKPIIALIHKNIGDLPSKKVEKTDKGQELLRAFTESAKNGRLVKFWRNEDDIKSAVITALSQQKECLEECGWIKYDDVLSIGEGKLLSDLSKENEELNNELNEVKKKNSDLVKELESNKATLKKIRKDNSDLQKKIENNNPEELSKKLIEVQKECAHLTSELEAKTNSISKMQNEIARLRDKSHSNSLPLGNKTQDLRKNSVVDPKNIRGNTENTRNFWVYFVNYILTRNDIHSDRNFLSVLNCNKSFTRDARFEIFFKVFSSYEDWINILRQAITKVYQYTCSTESKQKSYFNMPNIDYYTEVFDSQKYNRETLNNKISSFFTNYFFLIKYTNNPYSRVRSEALTCKKMMDHNCDTLLSYVYAAYMNGII